MSKKIRLSPKILFCISGFFFFIFSILFVFAAAPTVTTDPATSVIDTEAILNGTITDTGGEDAFETGFKYGTDPTLTTLIATSTLGAQTGTVSFTENLSGLTANTVFYFQSYAENSDGISYGTIRSFRTSSDTPWTEQTGSDQRSWMSITSSSDGIKLAAVDGGGFIYTSEDSGVTWTEQTDSGELNWLSIASSSDGIKLAAVNGGGFIYTSEDSGATWTEQTGSDQRSWTSITSSSDGTKLAATNNVGFIYTSTDSGVTWTEQTGSDQRSWASITSSSDGTKLGAVSYPNPRYIYTSTNSGVDWVQRVSAGQRIWLSITSSSDGIKLAAVDSGGFIYTSEDSGATWTEQTGSGMHYWTSITSSSDGTKLAAAAGYIYTSRDSGITWTEQIGPSFGTGERAWQSITSSSDGTKLAAAEAGGYIYTFSFSSPSVTTDAASSIAGTTATLNATIPYTGEEDPFEKGFEYGTSPTLATVIATSTLGTQAGVGSFSEDLTGLTSGTTYYFRAYASNSLGTSEGTIETFTTSGSSVSVPSLETLVASNIQNTSATLNGSITSTGGENATARGFVYGLTTDYGETTTETSSFGVGAFSTSITGLACATPYHLRAYATNSAGIGYGSDSSFTTSACPSTGGGNTSSGSSSRGSNLNPTPQAGQPSAETLPHLIPGCNGTVGFSTITGESCVNNTGGIVVIETYDFGLTTLRLGNKGDEVMDLQSFLNRFLNMNLAVDGILGPKTTAVIKIWQANHGLVADGLVGPLTKASMYSSIPSFPDTGEIIPNASESSGPEVKTGSKIPTSTILLGLGILTVFILLFVLARRGKLT